VVEELADDRNLSAVLVEQHKRPQRIPGLPDPADYGNLQYRNIPDPTSNSASHVPMRSNDT